MPVLDVHGMAVDVLAVHGVGGATGTLLTAFLATAAFGGAGLADGVSAGSQFIAQLVGVVVVLIWSVIATFVIVKIAEVVTGLRVDEDAEMEGLDTTAHGETGYNI